jgi:hypothetical protein
VAAPPSPATTLPAAVGEGTDRRQELRARYRALPAEAQDEFRSRLIEPDDLDAVAAALDEVEGVVAADRGRAAVATPSLAISESGSSEPSLGELRMMLGHGHDEGRKISDEEVARMRERHDALSDEGQFWCQMIAGQARVAGVPFYITAMATERRYWIYCGLIRLAAEPNDDAVRALAARATGRDAPLFPSVTVGHGVGAMDATEAREFCNSCFDYTAGELVAAFTGPDGAMRLVPV